MIGERARDDQGAEQGGLLFNLSVPSSAQKNERGKGKMFQQY